MDVGAAVHGQLAMLDATPMAGNVVSWAPATRRRSPNEAESTRPGAPGRHAPQQMASHRQRCPLGVERHLGLALAMAGKPVFQGPQAVHVLREGLRPRAAPGCTALRAIVPDRADRRSGPLRRRVAGSTRGGAWPVRRR